MRQTAYNVRSFHLLGERGRAGLKLWRAWKGPGLKIIDRKRAEPGRAGPKKQRAGAGRDF